jgi:DNA-cytosine methyltransferase
MLRKSIVLLDLFSGTGGFAKGFLAAGFQIRKHYFSEIDKHAVANYTYNFKDAEYVGRVEEITRKRIERPDVVTFGFPCQDLSLAGQRRGLDGARSGLFFEAVKVIRKFQPDVFVFENVQGLLTSNEGQDFEIILREIADLGLYECQWQLVNSSWFLPQNRERLYFVGHLGKKSRPQIFPFRESIALSSESIQKARQDSENIASAVTANYSKGVHARGETFVLTGSEDKLLKYEWPDDKKGQLRRIFDISGAAPTLCTIGRHLIYYKSSIRKLTPVECERLQGFPDDWTKYGVYDGEIKEISDTQRYKLLGNAVTVAVVKKIASALLSEKQAEGKEDEMEYEEAKEVVLYGIDEKNRFDLPEVKLTFVNVGKYSEKITSSAQAAEVIKKLYEKNSIEVQEQFYVLFLDRENKVKGFYRHTVGGITGAIVDIRLILAAALKSLSVGMIAAHNHPSGNMRPSEQDSHLTKKLKEAAKLMDIQLLDHLIIGSTESYFSFADEGLLGLPGVNDKSGKKDEINEALEEEEKEDSASMEGTVKKSSGGEKQKYIPEGKEESPSYEYKGKIKNAERLPEEVRFIKSFLSLNGKKVKAKSILNLLKRLQRAITAKIITKQSRYLDEINGIQNKLVKAANVILKNKIREEQAVPFSITDKDFIHQLKDKVSGNKVYTSIGFIQRLIGMQGKRIPKTKVQSFINQMQRALDKGSIASSDPYVDKVKGNIRLLKQHLASNERVVRISRSELNGLQGIVSGLNSLNGLGEVEQAPTGVMNSMDFVQLHFDTMGFKGKWLDFIGDPGLRFTAMIFGRPKFGKSYLCVDFAGYLARNHGKTLFVAVEEKLRNTLQQKIMERNVQHPYLEVSDVLPADLRQYRFVFIDSVTKMGLTPEELNLLESRNPNTSFLYIFHVRKDGKFRGRNDFQHDVDVVIEVPEKGRAVQYGRFNQGGELKIFESNDN